MNIKQVSILQGIIKTKHNSEHFMSLRIHHKEEQEKLEKRLPKGEIFELLPFHIHSFLMSHHEKVKKVFKFYIPHSIV